MTTASVFAILMRRWFVVALGIAATVLGLGIVFTSPVVYHGEVNVLFLAPRTPTNPNVLRSSSESLVSAAGMVKNELNDGEFEPGATLQLTVRGLENAESVTLPNAGSQWVDIYDRAVLHVEVTGDDPEDVSARLRSLAFRVRSTAKQLQVDLAVSPQNMIATELDPRTGQVRRMQGPRLRGLAVAGILGAVVTCWGTVEIDRLLKRRRKGMATRI